MNGAARRRFDLLVIPAIPNTPSKKPLIQGYGVRVGGDDVSCAALFVQKHVPAQTLDALLISRGSRAVKVRLDWSPIEPGLHGNATIDVSEP